MKDTRETAKETRRRSNALTVDDVRHLMNLLGGDNETEKAILAFIAHYYSADDLFQIPRHVYTEICKRPEDFKKAALAFVQPELALGAAGGGAVEG